MNIPTRLVLIALFCATLMAIILVMLARDVDRETASTWRSHLDELHLLSYKLDDQLLQVRGRIVFGYDGITETARRMRQAVDSLEARDAADDTGLVGLAQRLLRAEFGVDARVLKSLVAQRLTLIDDFKSDFATYVNSSMTLHQLVDELAAMNPADAAWVSDVRELQRRVLLEAPGLGPVTWASAPEDRSAAAWVDALQAHELSASQRSRLGSIARHLALVERAASRLRSQMVLQQQAAETTASEVVRLTRLIGKLYGQVDRVSTRQLHGLMAGCMIFLLYWLWRAGHAIYRAGQLRLQNATLESVVGERTQALQRESRLKDAITVDLERKKDELVRAKAKMQSIIDSIDGVVWERPAAPGAPYTFVSAQSDAVLGFSPQRVIAEPGLLHGLIHPEDLPRVETAFHDAELQPGGSFQVEYRMQRGTDRCIHIRNIVTPVIEGLRLLAFRGVMFDVTEYKELARERLRMETQLRQSQKLKAVGQLAAGIAHEINTPSQFVADNIHYFREAFGDLEGLFEHYEQLQESLDQPGLADATRERLQRLVAYRDKIDLTFLREDLPSAIDQALDGVSRISSIVKAMKEFSHPGGQGKEHVDLNRAIESTITVARNEWKYVAQVEKDLAPDLPLVECFPGDVNQTVLNIVVNAAHAIEARQQSEGDSTPGTIRISTRAEGGFAVIEIGDTGLGVSEEHQQKIFEPFFTTKEVGKGTGQGLYIAHSVVVEKHGGRLELDSQPGQGTRFIIRLPLGTGAKPAGDAAALQLAG